MENIKKIITFILSVAFSIFLLTIIGIKEMYGTFTYYMTLVGIYLITYRFIMGLFNLFSSNKLKNEKINQDLTKLKNINVSVGVSKDKFEQVDVKQIDNHLYIDGVEVRAIKFKNSTYKTIGQIIKKI